ncbi:MAG: hypothetical protein K2H21_05665 [Muribaculaceae bacterium]|nr:hypothetical protein [Muribaculaceae bacterium]
MKHFYLLERKYMLAAALGVMAVGCVSAADAVNVERFRANRAPKAPLRSEAAKIMRPSWERQYVNEYGEWTFMGEVQYEYDAKGNEIKSVLHEDNYVSTEISEYDEYGSRTLLVEMSGEGESARNSSKRTYEYDAVVHDYCIRRMGYDWSGSDWLPNYFCETNEITRNADGNITEILKSIPYSGGEDMVPAYHTVWGYDEASGEADSYAYYMNMTAATPTWKLYLDTEYRDIKWDRTDGQLTGELLYMLEGSNRLASATVYYQGEPDGYVFVTYPEDGSEGYLMLMTTNDPDEVGMSQEMKVSADADGGMTYVFTQTEYFDEETGEISTSPSYTLREEYAFDAKGNLTRDEIYEGVADEEPVLVSGQLIENTYDADGNLTEVLMRSFQYDDDTEEGEYVEELRIEYGDYVDAASAGICVAKRDVAALHMDGLTAVAEGCGIDVYSVDGSKVAGGEGAVSLKELPAGIYVVRAAGESLRVRR